MAELYFKVKADYTEAMKLAQEVEELEKKIKDLGSTADSNVLKGWEKQLAKTKTKLEKLVTKAASAVNSELGTGKIGGAFRAMSEAIGGSLPDVVKGAKTVEDAIERINKAIEDNDDKIKDSESALEELREKAKEAFQKGDREALKNYEAEIDNLTETIRSVQEETQKYGEILELLKNSQEEGAEASEEQAKKTALFKNVQNEAAKVWDKMPGPIKKFIGWIGKAGGAMLKFMAIPLVAALYAIAAAFAAVKKYLTSTIEGQRKLAYVTGAIKGVMTALNKVVISVGKKLFEAFSHPKQAVEDLWTAIKTRLVDRLSALGNVFTAFKKVITDVFSDRDALEEDVKALREAAKAVGDNFVEPFQKGAEAVKEFAKEVVDTADKMGKLEQKRFDLDLSMSNWEAQKEKLEARKAELEEVMNDTGIPLEMRLEAFDEYAKIEEKIRKTEEGFAASLASITRQQQLADGAESAEDRKQYNALLADATNKANDYAAALEKLKDQRDAIIRSAHKTEEEMYQLRTGNLAARIDLMEDGSTKALREIELEFERERHEIEERRWNWLDKQKGKLYGEQEAILTEQSILAEQRRDKAVLDLHQKFLEEYTLQYGSSYTKMAAIREKYEKQIAASSDENEKKTLRNKMQEEMFKASVEYGQIFGDITGLGESALTDLIDVAERAIKGVDITADGAIERVAELRRRINELRDARDQKMFGGWGMSTKDMLSSFNDLKSIQNQQKDAEKAYGEWRTKWIQAESQEDRNEAYGRMIDSLSALERAKNLTSEVITSMVKAFASGAMSGIGKGLKQVGDGLEGIGEAYKDAHLADIGHTLSGIGNVVGEVAEGFKTGGVYGAIAATVGMLGREVVNRFLGAKEAAAAAKKAADDYNYSLKLLNLTVKESEFENAFGRDDWGLMTITWGKMQDALAAVAEQSGKARENLLQLISLKMGASGLLSDDLRKVFDAAAQAEGFWDEMGNINTDVVEDWLKANNYTAEEFEKLKELKDAYESLKKAVSDYVSALTNSAAADIADKMVDQFIQTGSAILDMTDNLNDFKKNLASSIVQSMLLQKVFTQSAQDNISKLLANGDTNEAISAYKELLEQANMYAGDIEDFLQGINATAINSQKATAGGFQTMSQDTATELNGRFTALQVAGEHIWDNTNLLVANFETLLEKYGAQVVAVDDIRDIQAQALIELKSISDNTQSIVRPIREMNDTVSEIRRKVDKL